MKLSQQRRPLWCLSFLLGCLGALTTALAAPTVRLEVEDPLLEVGEEFTLELIVENVERLFGASLKIVFDPLRVDYLSAEPGELFLDGIEPPFLSVRESGDTLAVSTSRRVGDVEVSGSGALVLLRFRAIGAGVVNWTILPETVVLLDSQGAPVPGSGNVSLGGFGALVGDGLFLLSSEIVSRSPLVFSASGFAPNEPVRMAVDDAELAEPAIASRDGELVNVSANLPLIPGGEHRFSLRGVDSGRSYEAPFVVLPRLGRTAPFVLAPDGSRVYTQPGWGGTQVGPGDLVELIADGFGAEEDVRITVNGARVSTFLDPSRTDALGVLRTAVELPRELAGPDALLLLEGSRSRLRLEAPPNRWRIQPRITSLTPPVGGLGTRVRLTASGFTPGEVVDLYVNERLVGGVSGAVANTRGSISINLFIDEALVDRHVYTHFAIVLRGETGSAADGTFAYAPTATITDITPAGGDLNVSPGEEVRVRGFGFPPGAAVSLRFGDREVPVSAQVDADGNLDLTFVVPTLPFGRYDLTVRAGSAETTPRETLQIVGTILRATLEGGSTPEIGGFGTLLVVEGAGFEPDETVQFDLGSRRGVHQTRTQADGTFRAGIIIPELPNDLPDGRGTVPLRASTRRTSAEVPVFIAAPAPVDQFLQTAELTVTPSEAAVGETVRVRGIGFPANYLLGVLSLDTGLEARFSPTPLRIAEVRAGANTINGILTDGNGVFEVDVLLTDLGADGIGGEKEIFPTRPTGDDGRPLLAVPFRLKPFAQLIDAVGRPVTTVRPRSPVLVQAAGFAPGEGVQARIGNSFMVVEEPTDAFGRLVRASLQIGDVPGGEQTLSLLGLSSGVEAQIPVVVQSELRLVSPPAGTLVRPGDLIQVEGIGFPDGTVSFRIGEVPLTGTAVPINGFFVMSLFVPSVPLPTQAPITAAIGETTVASTSGTLRFATSQLTLEPTEGRVGTVVHVRGANGTGVLFGELVIGSLRNSQLVDGLWVGDFFVPPVPGGRYPVRVGVLPEGVQPPEFTVLPTLSVEPKALQIGEELTISGSAFRANSRVTISIGNAQTPYLAQSDPSGSFSLTVPVPRTNGDGVDVVATDGRLFVRERIEVLPLLVRVTAETSESGRVPVGADLTVEAAGLGPEEPVDVWLGPVPVQPRRPFTTTVDGSLLATFSMPPIPAGPQRVRVVGRHSGLTAEREGAVQVLPQLERPRPTTGAVGDTIELEGYGFAAGEGLEVRLGDQPIGEATADAFGRLSAEVLIRRALPDGEYPLIVVGRRSGLELTAPEPFRVRDTRRPVIERLELTPSADPLRAGDTIAVLVAEPPDSLETIVEATATLGPVQATLEPGAEPHTWVGELVIPPNLSLRNQTVEARLVDLAGNVGTRRSQERFTIDTMVNFSITDVEAPPVAAVGDEIVISGEGDANGTARFTIEGIAEDLPMEESPAGTYRGRYTVRAGDLARNARITVQFTNPAGNTLEIEAEETVTVDGVAELYSVAIVGSPARWGDTIVFVVTGEPNSRVRISIPGLITDQEIPELPSQRGTYRGEHRVTRREPLEDAVVRAVLVDPYGNQTINESQRVTILLPDALFLPLQEGINLVGIPIHDPRLERVSDLMELLPAAEMILWQEPTSGAFRAYRRGAPPFGRADGPIQVGAGYIVVMSAPGELVLDGDPGPAEIALRNGVNLITLTRRDPNLRRLSDLADRIGPTVQQVIAYDSSRRRFVAYRVGLPTDAPVNLPVSSEGAYLVVTNRASVLRLEGPPPVSSE